MMDKQATIYVAETDGFIGQALREVLHRQGFRNVLAGPATVALLRDAAAVEGFFSRTRPDYVFLIGGPAGGIRANQKFPARLMLENLLINCHVIDGAHRHGTKKLLYLASSCIYPKFSEQPMRVDDLMTGRLEPTNECYAIAKLAGVYLSQAYRRQFDAQFIVAVAANVFGPGDDFSEEESHVVGALMRRMHEAKIARRSHISIWGSGRPRREFIYSQDLAEACLLLMDRYKAAEPINVGVGSDWSIRELAETIRDVIGYDGELMFDDTQPDGMPAKLLDSSSLKELGWQPRTSLRQGIKATYQWFLEQKDAEGEVNGRAVL